MNCRIGGLGVVSVEVRRYTRSYHFTPYFPFKGTISRRENDRMLTKNTARVNRCALSSEIPHLGEGRAPSRPQGGEFISRRGRRGIM